VTFDGCRRTGRSKCDKDGDSGGGGTTDKGIDSVVVTVVLLAMTVSGRDVSNSARFLLQRNETYVMKDKI
jgi:flagellin-like protein